MRLAAEQIVGMGARGVVVKGGHMEGPATDLFYDGSRFQEFTSPRIDTVNTHGTGCTFASAITAQLALGGDIESAFRSAKKFVWEAMNAAYPVGQGHGPLNQMWRMPPEED
jgi:hydroxymethylpyrimidine/phosphomethylpyrimidine kinase